MIKDQDILCISSIDLDSISQGYQEIMATLVEEGNGVIFVENNSVFFRILRLGAFPFPTNPSGSLVELGPASVGHQGNSD